VPILNQTNFEAQSHTVNYKCQQDEYN